MTQFTRVVKDLHHHRPPNAKEGRGGPILRLPEGEVDPGIQQPQAALVTMETKTGYLRALIGAK